MPLACTVLMQRASSELPKPNVGLSVVSTAATRPVPCFFWFANISDSRAWTDPNVRVAPPSRTQRPACTAAAVLSWFAQAVSGAPPSPARHSRQTVPPRTLWGRLPPSLGSSRHDARPCDSASKSSSNRPGRSGGWPAT